MAFLTPFPNTKGFTVVIPKAHHASYVFDLPEATYTGLLLAAKQVGKLLDAKLHDVGRTGLIAEGFGVNHAHIKLIPMHGTADMQTWKPIRSSHREYFTTYPGYLSSHDGSNQESGERISR